MQIASASTHSCMAKGIDQDPNCTVCVKKYFTPERQVRLWYTGFSCRPPIISLSAWERGSLSQWYCFCCNE